MHYASYALQHCIAISWTWERVCLVLEHDSKNKKLLDGNKSIRLTWRMCDLPRCCWSILETAAHYGLHFNCPRQLTFQWRVRQLRASLGIYGSRVGVCARCVRVCRRCHKKPFTFFGNCWLQFFSCSFSVFLFFFLIVTINFSWQRHLHTFWWYNLPHMHAYDYYCYYYFF